MDDQNTFNFNTFWHNLENKAKSQYNYLVDPITCISGLELSIQASESHYCTPKQTCESIYTHWEVGFPSEKVEVLMPYVEDPDKPLNTIYAWVPTHIIEQVIKESGGVK